MDISFGHKIKSLREKNGLSQENLAKQLNVSRQAVYKWETNKGYPDIVNLIRISDIFEVTLDELIREDKDLQDKITIDEEEYFEKLSDPGFYIGIIILFISIFIENSPDYLMILGILCMVFFDDLLKSIKAAIRFK
ncbi:hypothetical protein GCM10008934_18240 [Virgibacillus salarius]|uniref:helix-turn-helix transcriptional regulator n=1 Tax=Virgibacillus salarius TaxID=447199 RepID=UPI0031D125FA